MGVSFELAEGIQADCFADDVPMPSDLGSNRWSEDALRKFFESGGEVVPPMISTPSKAPAVKARLEAQVAPARGEVIAETIGAHQQAAEARAAAALEARAAKAGQENAKAMRVKGDRDAFDTFIGESRRELSELSLAAASSNRAAALDERRSRAAAESLKVRAGVATASSFGHPQEVHGLYQWSSCPYVAARQHRWHDARSSASSQLADRVRNHDS